MTKLLSKIRLLPIVIFAATLLLTVKISDIVDGFDGAPDRLPVSSAVAQGTPAPPPSSGENLPQSGPLRTPNPPPVAGTPPAAGAKPSVPPAASKPESALDDPSLFTQNEIDLLQQLADWRDLLDSRVRELDAREGLLSAAEKRIDRKIQEMKNLEVAIQSLLKSHEQQEKGKIESLVKIYETMKPKQAARIFEQIELPTLLRVAERMKERKLAPIMALMDTAKAKEMTVELTRLRELPSGGAPIVSGRPRTPGS
ncbi:MAG: hypothetical protein O3A84_03260 [Proteobacteria bacterium]|nr:hypothetical protein [Pseudomonadota bacterium]